MDKLFIASNNKNKIREIKDILIKNNIFLDLLTPNDFEDKSEPIEDGNSFEENAIIKARYYFDKYKIPCIGEDSGICIEYFNNLPGIHSKRFLQNYDNYNKNEKILSIMNNVKNRKASFNTYICYIDENGEQHIFNGIHVGEISKQQKGNEGFGYDPIFLIPEFNKTEAELGNEYKNMNSHRAKALSKFVKYLNETKG